MHTAVARAADAELSAQRACGAVECHEKRSACCVLVAEHRQHLKRFEEVFGKAVACCGWQRIIVEVRQPERDHAAVEHEPEPLVGVRPLQRLEREDHPVREHAFGRVRCTREQVGERAFDDLERAYVEIEVMDVARNLRQYRRRGNYEAGRDAALRFRYVSMS